MPHLGTSLRCAAKCDIRHEFFTSSSLKNIFESVNNQNIIDAIKDIHFYSASTSLAMQTAVIARGIPSVCLSRSGIVSRRMKIYDRAVFETAQDRR